MTALEIYVLLSALLCNCRLSVSGSSEDQGDFIEADLSVAADSDDQHDMSMEEHHNDNESLQAHLARSCSLEAIQRTDSSGRITSSNPDISTAAVDDEITHGAHHYHQLGPSHSNHSDLSREAYLDEMVMLSDMNENQLAWHRNEVRSRSFNCETCQCDQWTARNTADVTGTCRIL